MYIYIYFILNLHYVLHISCLLSLFKTVCVVLIKIILSSKALLVFFNINILLKFVGKKMQDLYQHFMYQVIFVPNVPNSIYFCTELVCTC